jgi:tetratricopeptide (TPR) repeat protein
MSRERWREAESLALAELGREGSDRARALGYLARAQVALERFEEAARTYESLLRDHGGASSASERMAWQRAAILARHGNRETREFLEEQVAALARHLAERGADPLACAELHNAAFSYANLPARYAEWGEETALAQEDALDRAVEIYLMAIEGYARLPGEALDRDLVHSSFIAAAAILRERRRHEEAADLLQWYLEAYNDSPAELLAIARRMLESLGGRLARAPWPSAPAKAPVEGTLAREAEPASAPARAAKEELEDEPEAGAAPSASVPPPGQHRPAASTPLGAGAIAALLAGILASSAVAASLLRKALR